MGKIADALEKYAQESKTARLPGLTRADLAVLLSYNRKTGHLLNYEDQTGHVVNASMAVLRNKGTIQRLLDNKLIFPNGKLTPKGLKESERLRSMMPSVSNGSHSVDQSTSAYRDAAALLAQKEEKNHIEDQPPSEDPAKIVPSDLQKASQISEEKAPVPERLIPREETPTAKELTSAAQRQKQGRVNKLPIPTAITQDKPAVSTQKLKDSLLEQLDQEEPLAVAGLEKEGKRVETDQRIVGEKTVPFDLKTVDRNLVTLLKPQSYEAEQFKILRTNLLFPVSGAAPRSILVTGALPADGKSFVSANLAVSIAMNINKHVLLIDCDLRKPDLNRLFGLGNTAGLSDYLQNHKTLESLLVRTGIDKLTLLPSGPVPPNPSELMSSERMSELINEVKQRYHDRLIVIDSPPPGLAAETAFLARNVDGVILVLKYGKTSTTEIENLIKTVGSDKIIGCVLNQLDNPVSRYNGYKKYKKYGKRYDK